MRVLVADDDESVRTAFVKLLTIMGHQCESAADGKECLARLLAGSYDLLVVDLVMPTLDGETVISSIRGRYPSMHIVVVSAQDDEEIIGQILRMGASAYLVKPLMIDGLKDVINKIAEKKTNKKI